MAQIYVFGRVEDDLVIKKSLKGSSYVCFSFREQTSKGQSQSYQVWAWNEDVSRLEKLGVKKGSLLWITGTMQLVDCTEESGKVRAKVLKIFLTNWGYLPGKYPRKNEANAEDNTEQTPEILLPPITVMDGDRDALPE